MIRKILLILVIVTLLAVAFVGLVTWQFSRVVTPQLARYLEPYGIEALHSAGIRWHWHQVVIGELSFSGEQQDWRFSGRADGIALRWRWRGLFAGEVDSLAIDRLNIRVNQTSSAASPDGPVELAALMPHNWLPDIPVSTVRLARGELIVELADGPVPVQVQTLKLRRHGTAVEARVSTPVSALPDPVPGGDLRLRLNLRDDEQSPLSVELKLVDGDEEPPISFSIAVNDVAMQGEAPIPVTATGSIDVGALQMQWPELVAFARDYLGESGIPGDGEWPDLTGQITVSATSALPVTVGADLGQILAQLPLALDLHHRLSLSDYGMPSMGEEGGATVLEGITVEGGYRYSGASGAGELMVAEPLRIGGKIRFADPLPGVPGQWPEAVPFTLRVGAENGTNRPASVRIEDGAVTADNIALELIVGDNGAPWRLQGRFLTLNGAPGNGAPGELQLRLSAPVYDGERLWPVEADAALTFRRDQGAFPLAGQLMVPAYGYTGQLNAGGAELHLDSQVDIPVLSAKVASIGELPVSLAIASGKMTLQYAWTRGAESTKQSNQRVHFELADVTGLVDRVAVEGGTAEGTLVFQDGWRSEPALVFAVDRLATGVAIDRLRGTADVLSSDEGVRLRLASLSADLFGGSVRLAEPFVMAVPPDSANFRLTLTDWQLGQILALYRDQGLAGSGVLSGTLPVQWSEKGVQIDGGSIASQPPGGQIVYTLNGSGQSLAERNREFGMALKLLENFQYDRLEASAVFQPNGQMLLGLKLAGRNPDQFDGRAVNFNINVEENLFDLLTSLQLSSDLIRQLELRLDRRQ